MRRCSGVFASEPGAYGIACILSNRVNSCDGRSVRSAVFSVIRASPSAVATRCLKPAGRNLGAVVAGDAVAHVAVTELDQDVAQRLAERLAPGDRHQVVLTVRGSRLDQVVDQLSRGEPVSTGPATLISEWKARCFSVDWARSAAGASEHDSSVSAFGFTGVDE